MLKKVMSWVSQKKKEIHTKRLENMIDRLCRPELQAESTTCRFLKLSSDEQIVILNKLETSAQVYRIISYSDEGRMINIFHDLSLDVRREALKRLSVQDLQNFLIERPYENKKCQQSKQHQLILPLPNFFAAPQEYQEHFLLNMCTQRERIDFLIMKTGIDETAFEYLTKNNVELADKILMNLNDFHGLRSTIRTFENKGLYYWPRNCSPMAQEYILSLIPFEEMDAFLRRKDDAQVSLLEKMPPFIQKKVISLYENHPHLLLRLFSDGAMKHMSWPVITQAALQMRNKKYVLKMFKTPSDETGKKAFYKTPYKAFRQAVYKKFPELDIHPEAKSRHHLKLSQNDRQKGAL